VNTLPDLIFKATKSGAQTTGLGRQADRLAGWLKDYLRKDDFLFVGEA